ncbi:MAG: hypothetical protein WBG46_08315 [Nonlabens sp.]
MINEKQRKEVSLDRNTIAILSVQAEREGRKLKNYMENILREQANSFELTDDYKLMMDEKLNNYNKGRVKTISEENFRKQVER